jgi:hypothetical protein
VSERMQWAYSGVRGGGVRPTLGECRGENPLAWGSGGSTPEKKKSSSGNVTPTSGNLSCI